MDKTPDPIHDTAAWRGHVRAKMEAEIAAVPVPPGVENWIDIECRKHSADPVEQLMYKAELRREYQARRYGTDFDQSAETLRSVGIGYQRLPPGRARGV